MKILCSKETGYLNSVRKPRRFHYGLMMSDVNNLLYLFYIGSYNKDICNGCEAICESDDFEERGGRWEENEKIYHQLIQN